MHPPSRLRSHAVFRCTILGVVILASARSGMAVAQQGTAAPLDPVVVTATRSAERAFDLPAAIDTVDREQIQQGQLQVNLSESLARVPGMSIQNRRNYAQDLQLSIRGFGARANFGVRGVRLYQDDIPATMPDGQGQTGSFSLVSAQRIEVLRGPFSTLYGNASGGVISVFTEDGPQPPQASAQADRRQLRHLQRRSRRSTGTTGARQLRRSPATVSRPTATATTARRRATSSTRRSVAGSRPDTTVTLIGNALDQPDAQDPLGLTRAQWEANPRQADPAATRFDTRKTVRQTQGGVDRRAAASRRRPRLRGPAYGGTRTVQQYLSFPGTATTSSGGVTDLDRTFGGIDARVTTRVRDRRRGGAHSRWAPTTNPQRETRQGFVNDNGDARRSAPRRGQHRDEQRRLRCSSSGGRCARCRVLAGVRYSDVRFTSDDH